MEYFDSHAKAGKEATADYPCPICRKPDWCLHLLDGAVVCHRSEQAPPGWTIAKTRAKNGSFIFRPKRHAQTCDNKPIQATWKRTGKHDLKTAAFEKAITFQYSPTQRVLRREWSDRRAVYKDRRGTLKTKLVRPQYWDGEGWKWGRGSDPWPLYREDTIQREKILFFVGGETCVEALRQWGFSATCNQGGEGQYIDDIVKRPKKLQPRSLVIWPDNDEQGYKSAEALLTACQQNGIQASILNPLELNPTAPPKWDAADWTIDANDARDRIKAVVQSLEFHPQNVSVQSSQTPPKELPKLAQTYHEIEAALGKSLRFNELTNQIELNDSVVEEPDDLRLTLALEHGIQVSTADCLTIINRLARLNCVHPVRKYLEQCGQTYGSSIQNLEGMAKRYFGLSQPIYQTFLVKTLVAAVARVFNPGCKVDTALILQGPQGYRKSSFFRTLAGSDWFDDSMGAANERDERLKLHQFWFVEWGELEGILRKKDTSGVKAFLSCQIDTVRPPYGRHAIRLKRRSIIVGSTNQSEFLSDATGNRRFWVVPVQHRIDLDLLQRERDQIWAAALALYQSGYPVFLSDDEEVIAAELNAAYQHEDPWMGRIVAYLRDSHIDEITIAELLSQALEIEVGNQSKRDEMRVSDVLKSISWISTRKVFRGIRRRVWVSPEYDSSFESEVDHPAQPSEEVSHEVSPTFEPLVTGHSDRWHNLDSLDPQKTETPERNGYQLTTAVIPPPHSQEEPISPLDTDSVNEIHEPERRDSNGT